MLFLLLLIGLTLISFRGFTVGRDAVREPISLSVSVWLRGLLVLFVVFHHVQASVFEYPFVVKLAGSCGRYAVSLFFFLSGYGLMLQYVRKGREMFVGFFRKRVCKVLLPLLVAIGVYAIAQWVTEGSLQAVRSLTDLEWFVPFSWFVYELLAFYAAFYLLFRYLPVPAALVALACLCSAAMYGISLTELNNHWWISSLSFPIGCALAHGEDLLRRHCVAFGLFLITLSVLRFCVGLWQPKAVLWPYALLNVPVWLSFSWMFLSRLSVREKGVTAFLGKISYELYLYQGLAFLWCAPLMKYPSAYILCLLVSLLLIGYAMHRLDGIVKNAVLR